MKITNLQQIPLEPVGVVGAEGCAYRVAISGRDGAPGFAMRIFEIVPGGYTPLHEHPYEHEVFVLDGAGVVWRDGAEVAIKPGDVLFVPPGEKHQFRNTGLQTLKFICVVPVEFQK
ncbi:MAG: cupin domain-containing protein [Verrucomicrobiae bacterium]|nr:cupin domain-containing protein [Verrucomicrobiae bacterium]